MERPTEFLPVYDQTQKQAADMVEKMFVEIENLEAERDSFKEKYDTMYDLAEEVGQERDELRAQLEAVRAIVNQAWAEDEALLDSLTKKEGKDGG